MGTATTIPDTKIRRIYIAYFLGFLSTNNQKCFGNVMYHPYVLVLPQSHKKWFPFLVYWYLRKRIYLRSHRHFPSGETVVKSVGLIKKRMFHHLIQISNAYLFINKLWNTNSSNRYSTCKLFNAFKFCILSNELNKSTYVIYFVIATICRICLIIIPIE